MTHVRIGTVDRQLIASLRYDGTASGCTADEVAARHNRGRRHDLGSKTGADRQLMRGCDPDSTALSRTAKEGLGQHSNRGSRHDHGSLVAAASVSA